MERPEPAVGQVWRTRSGNHFVISRSRFTTGSQYSITFENGDCISCCDTVSECVSETDTYVGQFDGFKVKETT
jgi:hypothetical protein